jgi:N6-L-threonylcarbamoyladenine synthase
MIVLGIETTCDETSVGIINFLQKKRKNSDLPEIQELALIVLSQDFHSVYGGVVPELASRAHLENIAQVLKNAIERAKIEISDVDIVSVANEPGLPGSLIVGVSFAKGLAQSLNKKVVPVNHVEAHIISPLIENDLKFPFASLIVSGGHTSLYLVEGIGNYKLLLKTRDDSVGEVFDKVAKFFRFGYPGGPIIDSISKDAESFFLFPEIQVEDFSFSGIKTFSVRAPLNWFGPFLLPEFFSSFQKKVIDDIISKTIRVIKDVGVDLVAVSGGVARNSYFRQRVKDFSEIKFVFPSPKYCIDNGSMIAFLGGLKILLRKIDNFDFDFDIRPTGVLKSKGGIDL